MELYQLEYFLEAARQRNFTRAAERLHLAQAALSEQMRKLEAELGAALFHRGKRETTLTPAGETLRQHAEQLIAHASQAKRAVQDLLQLKGGRLVIGAIPSVSACLLPALIAAFRRKHPQIELTLLEGTSQGVAQWVENGQADLGIVQLPAATGAVVAAPLFSERFVLLVPASHRFAGKRHVSLAALSSEGFVFYKGRARDVVHAACRTAGFEPRVACESGELETVRALVEAGLGLAIVPQLAARDLPKRLRAVALREPSVERELGLITRRDHEWSPAAKEFAALLHRGGR